MWHVRCYFLFSVITKRILLLSASSIYIHDFERIDTRDTRACEKHAWRVYACCQSIYRHRFVSMILLLNECCQWKSMQPFIDRNDETERTNNPWSKREEKYLHRYRVETSSNVIKRSILVNKHTERSLLARIISSFEIDREYNIRLLFSSSEFWIRRRRMPCVTVEEKRIIRIIRAITRKIERLAKRLDDNSKQWLKYRSGFLNVQNKLWKTLWKTIRSLVNDR